MVLFPSFEASVLVSCEDVDVVGKMGEPDAADVVVPDDHVFRCAPENSLKMRS